MDLILDLDPEIRGVNRVMYQHDLKIQKGLKNKIRIQFKNSDQKRINVNTTDTYVFSMFDSINRRLLLEKEITVLDAGTTSTRGLAELTLTETDTLNFDKGSYTYAIKYLDQSDGSYLPAYSNTYYGINGTLYIYEDSYPVLQPSVEVEDFQISYNGTTELYEYKSRAVYANPELNGNTALHTLAFYLTGFKGIVYIQATLNNNPDDLGSYSTIKTLTYTGYTGVDYVNINGVFSYLNLLVIPEKGPLDLDNKDNQAYRGTFDKFLYRS